MKEVLVLGAGGMAGHVVATHLKEAGYNVSTVSAKNKLDEETTLIDVTNSQALLEYLSEREFDVLVNCVGMLVKASEERKDLAVYINSYLPHQLERFYQDTDTKLIHLSTDCVFSGKNAPYSEASLPDGELFYDKTKMLGEINNDKDLTFRMSIVGPDAQSEGTGLFNWFYKQTGVVDGYTGSVWNGVTTIELAKAVDGAIRQNLTGLYHLVPSGNITKYELLNLFKEAFDRKDIVVNPVQGVAHDKTLVNTRSDFIHTLPDYPAMVREMKEWVEKHPHLYSHYQKVSHEK